MADKMWMGIPTKHMQWVPCPLIDSGITRKRYVDRIQFENGGGDVVRSNAYQMEYNFEFSGPAHEVEGIDAFNKFASGYYGTGFIQVAHPANFETNLFPANWATPALAGQGWKNPNDSSEGSTSVSTISPVKFNYMKNPSFQASYPLSWTSSSSTLSIDNTQGVSGTRALKVVTTSSNSSGAYSAPGSTLAVGQLATFSAYIKATQQVRLTASNFTVTSATIDGTSATVTSNYVVTPTDGAYHRISITGTSAGGFSNMQVFNNSSMINTFYVDNIMLELENLSDFFDGSTADTSTWDYAWLNPTSPTDSISTASYKIIDSGVPAKALKMLISSSINTGDNKVTIPIPPGYILNMGVTGTSTGDAVVQTRPILADNTYAAKENLTLLPYYESTRFNKTYSGNTYNAVEVYFTRTNTSYNPLGSTLTIASMMAQLYPVGATPTLPTSHIYGEGSTGMMFADDAIVETYSYMYPPRKGISTTLVEVEAWR